MVLPVFLAKVQYRKLLFTKSDLQMGKLGQKMHFYKISFVLGKAGNIKKGKQRF